MSRLILSLALITASALSIVTTFLTDFILGIDLDEDIYAKIREIFFPLSLSIKIKWNDDFIELKPNNCTTDELRRFSCSFHIPTNISTNRSNTVTVIVKIGEKR